MGDVGVGVFRLGFGLKMTHVAAYERIYDGMIGNRSWVIDITPQVDEGPGAPSAGYGTQCIAKLLFMAFW